MTRMQRFGNIVSGVILLLLSILLLVEYQFGYVLIVIMISLLLTIAGIRMLIYYFRMARYMVGGKRMLYFGVIALDFGIFTLSMLNASQIFIIMYLFLTFALTGIASFLRGIEAKRYDAPGWRWRIIYGVINVAVVLVSIIFIRSQSVLVIIFSIGLLYTAVLRILSVFRRTAIVYVQ